MSTSSPIALTEQWWVTRRDIPSIRKALKRASLEMWVPAVECRLNEFREAQASPATWEELANQLSRDGVTIWRWKSGQTNLSSEAFLSLASALNLDVSQLLPKTDSWVASASQVICPSIHFRTDAISYARYALIATHRRTLLPQVSGQVIEEMVEAYPEETRPKDALKQIVQSVADNLNPVLQSLTDDGEVQGHA